MSAAIRMPATHLHAWRALRNRGQSAAPVYGPARSIRRPASARELTSPAVLPSLVRILGETAAHDVVHGRRHQRLKRGHRGRFVLEEWRRGHWSRCPRRTRASRSTSRRRPLRTRTGRYVRLPRGLRSVRAPCTGPYPGWRRGASRSRRHLRAARRAIARPRQAWYRRWSHRRLADPHLRPAGISRGQNRAASRRSPSA